MGGLQFIALLPSGEGAPRADEGQGASLGAARALVASPSPHPALRATFPQRGKGENKNGASLCC